MEVVCDEVHVVPRLLCFSTSTWLVVDLVRLGAGLAGVSAGREGLARWLAVFRVQWPRRMTDRDLCGKRDRLWNLKDGGRRIGPSHAQLAFIEVIVMVILYVLAGLMRQTPHFPPSGVLEQWK